MLDNCGKKGFFLESFIRLLGWVYRGYVVFIGRGFCLIVVVFMLDVVFFLEVMEDFV